MKKYPNSIFKGLSLLYIALLTYIVLGAEWRWKYDIIEIRKVLNVVPLYNKIEVWPPWDPFSKHSTEFYLDLVGNIVLFIPFPFFLFFIFQVLSFRTQLVLTIITSLFIEINQYYWGIGVTDIDDLILNTLGGFIGANLLQALLNNKVFRTYAYSHLRH
ncbi:VanZ family protein [Parapedobacter koreensis]|uniref:VanZ like family protein n=1 Tax=Parapedobacter koreensis TaxID=332977 RepID=A0A1H7NNV0_9SPHI|nr:VanZ like family protein [Parapedobacter koreensis]